MYQKKLNLVINFFELRLRLVYCFFSFSFSFFIGFIYKIELFFCFSKSFLELQGEFIYTGLLDPLLTYIKMVFLIAGISVLPIWIYILGFFFFKSLKNNQVIFFCFSFFSLYIIIILLYYLTYKLLAFYFLKFLLTFQEPNIESLFQLYLQATIVQYYSILIKGMSIYLFLILAPLTFLFLVIIKLIPENYFLNFNYRKYLYLVVGFFILIFMPPDIFIQLLIIPVIFFILEIYFYIITFYFLLFKFFFK